jgi:superfamily II DNA or RNA helicase
MTREQAVKLLRQTLDENNLPDWKIRVTTDITKPFLGLCDYNIKTIFLNGFSIDTHPDSVVINTIKHEVSHALVGPGHAHDDVWKEMARKLGCDNTRECGLSLNLAAIDAIRSGASLEVTYETEVIHTPKYKVTRLQDHCPVCNKVAIEVKTWTQTSGDNDRQFTLLKCGHLSVKLLPKQTPFHTLTSIVENSCPDNKHTWNSTVCSVCGAIKPYQFQIDGMKFLERALAISKGAAIFDEMGLGKTIQVLGLLRFHPEMFPILIICPSSIKYQWASESERILGSNYFPQIISVGKSHVLKWPKIYITSYDLLRRLDISQFKHVKTVILDECQKIKNVDATRTQQVRMLVRETPNVIPLSGSPWDNRGDEFFPVLNIVSPVKFNSFENFKNRWLDYYWDNGKQRAGGIRNIPQFREYTKDIIIRRERQEVMKELPLISRNRLHTQIDSSSRKLYDETVSDFVKSYNQSIIDGTEDDFATLQSTIAQLQRMRHILGLAKIPDTIEQVKQFTEQTSRKMIVFVHHKDVGAIIHDQLGKELNSGYQVMKLVAEMNSEERYDTANKFNTTDKVVLVASTRACGEGLNLQTCSDVIMHERQWTPAAEEQAEGRVIRIGQKMSHVSATYVHAENSVDTQLDTIVERKRHQFAAAMNKGEIPQWNERSIMKELAQAIVNEFNKDKK